MAMSREERRAQILSVATAVFAEKGYHDARIDEIVARAGIARGTFYLYFEDKRSIFEHIVDGFLQRLDDAIRVIELDDPTTPPSEQLRDDLLRVVALFASNPQTAQILLSAAVGLDADFDRKLLAFYDALTSLLERALTEGETAGLVRVGNRRVRSFCLTGIIKELLYQLVLRKTEASPQELVDVMLDLVAHGLFTESGTRALRGE
jgi:AcrR family transcriptional regulator